MDEVPSEAQRWEARDGDAIVARAALWPISGPRYRLALVVDEAHRRRGHGDRLLAQALEAARARTATSVQVRPNAADATSIAFAAKRGFTESMRMHHLVLDLAAANHTALLEGIDKLASAAIAIVTLADFSARSKDPMGAYRDLVEAARDGWPDADPELSGEPPARADPHAIVAEQKGRLVGFTGALGTGVRPELRNMGIATALKACAIDAAIARGETTMTTATGHPAMRHIDEKLGFREAWCELRMVRRLSV